jgi:ribonuclease HI
MIHVYVDGGTRDMAICLHDPQRRKTIVKTRKGAATNNDLEYLAVIYGIEYVRKYYPKDKITIISDSMLVVKQVNQLWKIRSNSLAALNKKVLNKKTKLIKIKWVPRDINQAGLHLDSLKPSKGKSK